MKLQLDDVIRSHISAAMPNIYTSLPARVIGVGVVGTGVVVDAQILVNRTEPDGSIIEGATIPEVPVIFPAGGGALISLPLRVGDTVMLMFSMRSTEEFLASDGVEQQTPFSKRTHSLSDPIAIPGLFTSVNSPVIDLEDVQIRNGIDATESLIKVKQDGRIIIQAASSVEIGEGAAESLVLGTAFKALYDGHTHPTGTGPSGTPINGPMVQGTHLSDYATTL